MKKTLYNLKNKLKDIIQDVEAIYLDKGPEPFKKPMLYAISAIVISYLIYLSNKGPLKNNQDEFERINQLANFYSEYIDLKKNIKNYLPMLPSIKDKDEWLNYILNTTAAKYSIIFTNVESQKELKIGDNIYVVSKQVQFATDYETLGKFIRDIENSPIFVEVSNFSAFKKNDPQIIKIDVTLTLTTVFIEGIV
ncbi:MAG: type 4a pilus biogenesis protein PilO [Elusimicrobiota bacterium]